jgi:hypothetical protein
MHNATWNDSLDFLTLDDESVDPGTRALRAPAARVRL